MTITIAGKQVGAIGFGMLNLTNPAKGISTEDAIAVLKAALNEGANLWNASQHYGVEDYNSLHLLKAYFTKYPEDVEKVVIMVKGCYDLATRASTVTPEGVRKSIDRCLEIADGKFRIDIFEPGRLDRNVPVEDTFGAITEYVDAGKIGSAGITECSAASIRKAASITPIAAAELELSLFETHILENGAAGACKELNIPIAAFCPLSRGFLTGTVRKYEDLGEKDFRRMLPRFSPENFSINMKLVQDVEEMAARKGCTSGQIAIAWVSQQSQQVGTSIIPIPGASSFSHLHENLTLVKLTDDELRHIDGALAKTEIKGGRYPAAFTDQLEI
jgi:pyridoxine 4-dehydrogenase